MTQALYLGIDGGGTRCRARLCDESGQILGEGVAGAANLRLGSKHAYGSILTAANLAREQAGLPEDIWQRTHTGFGLAGAGQRSARQNFMSQSFPFASITVDTDAKIAWLGATSSAKTHDRGAILIIGTGVCGYMEGPEGPISIGGWGFSLSDEGSGAVLGREAIRHTLRVYDGLIPGGLLSDIILADIGPTPEQIVDWADAATPADYARFAPYVYACARKGDELACRLVLEAAAAIQRLTLRLIALGAPRVHLMGGVSEAIRPWLDEAICHHFAPPHADALTGALTMAGAPFALA